MCEGGCEYEFGFCEWCEAQEPCCICGIEYPRGWILCDRCGMMTCELCQMASPVPLRPWEEDTEQVCMSCYRNLRREIGRYSHAQGIAG